MGGGKAAMDTIYTKGYRYKGDGGYVRDVPGHHLRGIRPRVDEKLCVEFSGKNVAAGRLGRL